MFYFPRTPDHLRDAPAYNRQDYIADMLVPLTNEEGIERFRRLGYGELEEMPTWAGVAEEPDGHLYTCRHWDEETRLCGAYEMRPPMCADYPYGGECSHGCDYVAPLEVRERWLSRGGGFDWSRWRWDSRYGGYRPRPGRAMAADWVPGTGWHWDGQTLIPVADRVTWDHRKRRWVEEDAS